ncbi:MAG: biotin/lipoyl-containing protein [Christensenellaceae bacterium]
MRNFIVTIDGKQYQVGVEEVGATLDSAPVVQQIAPVAKAAAPAAAVTDGTKLNAPMPGMIKKLSKNEGDTVKKGEVVLVLEAMKMDNDITAPCDGKISYKVASGSNVDSGVTLAIIG